MLFVRISIQKLLKFVGLNETDHFPVCQTKRESLFRVSVQKPIKSFWVNERNFAPLSIQKPF